jgi:hypothetical protein
VFPNIVHEFTYTVTNNGVDSCSQFRLEFSGDFLSMGSPYVICSIGSAYFSGPDLYWNGNLNPSATVTLQVRAEVTSGGRAHLLRELNTNSNQAYVPLNYSFEVKMSTGTNYGDVLTTSSSLEHRQHRLYRRTSPGPINLSAAPTGPSQSFASGGNGAGTFDFSLSSLTQSSIQVIPDVQTFSTDFITVIDGFNDVLGDFGYVYYQGRTTTSYFPTILLSTYYDEVITSNVTTLRSGADLFTEAGIEDTVFLTPALIFGTNSVSGSTTITHSYYPI